MTTALTTTQLAELAGVHQTTILKAIQAGKIKASTTPGGHCRISHEAAVDFLNSMGIDPGPLARRRVRILGLFSEKMLGDAVTSAVEQDGRFEIHRVEDAIELGMMLERLTPEMPPLSRN